MSVVKRSSATDPGIHEFELTNGAGTMVAKISEFGARLTHLLVPDRSGSMVDVVMGFDTYEQLQHSINSIDDPYAGAVIGRISGRVCPSDKVRLNGTTYKLFANEPLTNSSLHGGKIGFDKKVWKGEILPCPEPGSASAKFTMVSPDGDENYPGTLNLSLVYTVTAKNELKFGYEANLDSEPGTGASGGVGETALSLTNHAYFNLSGFQDPTVLHHYCHFASKDHLLADMDSLTLIGVHSQELGSSESAIRDPIYDNEFDSVMDFMTKPKRIGDDIHSHKLAKFRGYDHAYALLPTKTNDRLQTIPISKIASVWSETTGIKMDVLTDEPSFVFYTGNWVSDQLVGKNGVRYGPHCAFSIECQRYNNAISIDSWREQVLLSRDQTYSQNSIYQFSLI
ncbi:Aldose 1-epimerase [Smittium mucronatum]|uniref:Aldose 1-epimerase n=1 Tax=Smittium mucronatum TaxID=133383 RepID=A0A1R0GW66_9FUNG|nr:Aldose 1-epimerase [Smittium mucronatum]